MAEYTEQLTIAVSPALKQAIAEEAARQGRKPTAMARHTLRRVYLASQVTVEQCNEAMGDQVHYHDFVPERKLEEIDDDLYGPQLRVSKMVDTPEPYNAQAGE